MYKVTNKYLGGNTMKAKCIYAISPILEEGKVYDVALLTNGFLLLRDFPYNHFNVKHFEIIQ